MDRMDYDYGGNQFLALAEGRSPPPPPTTTISTIAVQSGGTRLVIALLRSKEWLELKVLEVKPELTQLGETLDEARDLLAAHDDVLRQLESKQSPVEELLRQADQLIANQRPRAEVYAAMAESLGAAWKDVNSHFDERKQILASNLNYKREEQKCLRLMDQLEATCQDVSVPINIEEVKHLLSRLHSLKRSMLESLMSTLQEGKSLLDKLKAIAAAGTLDSRPDNIKVSSDRAVSKVEHWLEKLHDRRKFIELSWQSRKTQVEQCLALALLAKELLEIEEILRRRREVFLRSGERLGDSSHNAKILMEELSKYLTEAKDLQERTLKITKSTEKLVSPGHFAGEQAIAQSYAVLSDCADYIDSIGKREEILDLAINFFNAAEKAFGRMNELERQATRTDLPATSPALAKLHSDLINALDECVEPAVNLGEQILERIDVNSAGGQVVRDTIQKLKSRKVNLEGACTAHREENLKISQSVNNFLENYNELYSWLITTVEAFLQGHQDMGSDLPISRDFLDAHTQLQTKLRIKEEELKSLMTVLPSIASHLDGPARKDLEEKMRSLQEEWVKTKTILENRIELARTYVKFHSSVAEIGNELDSLEEQFRKRDSVGDQTLKRIEERWLTIRQLYVQLSHIGKNFMEDSEKIMDPYLDVKRASLCIQTLLDRFGQRELVASESCQKWQSSINTKKEVKIQWETNMADCIRTLDWVSKIQPQLYPILLEDYDSCKDVCRELQRKEQIVIPEVKKAETEIELRVKAAEALALKGEAPPESNEKALKELIAIHEKLQHTLTEYQVLLQMMEAFFKNLSQVESTIENNSKQNQTYLPNSRQEVEILVKEHEAFNQAVLELYKFTENERDSIVNKINAIEPESVKQSDIDKINQFLKRKQTNFEEKSAQRKMQLEQHRQLCLFDEDLREINATLSDLNDQLISIRGQYGESSASAKATSQAFVYFEKTIELLEQRIKTFVKSGEDLISTDHSSSLHIEKELKNTRDKWDAFYRQVKESRRLIDLSIQYFSLVEEAEEWFREGGRLLVTIARKTTSVKRPDEATELLNEVEVFLKPGEQRQDQRIKRISELASQLYGEEGVKRMKPVLNENKEMIDSFTLISEELNKLALNLKQSEEERERLKKEQQEIDAGLSAVKAEALAAKAAAAAAEEARRAAELAARALRENVVTHTIEKVIIKEVASDVDGKTSPPTKKSKTDESAPRFIWPLRDATVKEGAKFKFECKVIGSPRPDVAWFKENIPVESNPDYQTDFDEETGVCTLSIEETFTEDSAKFTCRAVNSVGSAETTATLTVAETEMEEILVPAKFTKPLTNDSCEEGGTCELTCFVEGYPLPTVQWFKGDTCIDTSPDYVITYNNGEARLRFEKVFLEDQGQYTCKAANKVGTDECSAYFSVKPLEPTTAPEIVTPLSNVMARTGQKIKLECEVRGQPEPQVYWTRDGKVLRPGYDAKINYEDNVASLIIQETYPKDAGRYTLTAKNIAGEATSSSNVVVKGIIPNETSDSEMASDAEPSKPSIQLQLKDQSVFEGKSVRLDCIIVGQPEPEVIWYHDGVPVKESNDFLLLFEGDHCSLVIKEVFVEDAGEYKVVAINSAGETSSSCRLCVTPVKSFEDKEEIEETVVEEVKEPPKFTKLLSDVLVDESENVLLECCVSAEPEAEINWYLNNQLLDASERIQMEEDSEGNVKLLITNAVPEDKGVYTVKATNPNGEAKSFAQVIVKAKPKQQEEKNTLPVFKEALCDVVVNEGDIPTFECMIVGKPKPKVRWSFNEEPVSGKNFVESSVGNKHTLSIANVTKDDSGVVSCVAENDVGKSTSTAKLIVRDSSLHQEVSLVPFIEDKMETSTVSTKRQYFMETSSSTQIKSTISSGEAPQVEIHSYSTREEKSRKEANEQPVEEVKAQESKEFHQVNQEKPTVIEKSSLVITKDGQVTQETIKANSSVSLTPKLTRKSTAPRFITPVQGKIVDQGADVELEGVVDGYPQPSVIWTKNEQEVKSIPDKTELSFELNHAKLSIKNADVKDAGRYSCKAANSVGTAISTADVVVKKTVFPPVLGKRLQAQTVPKGERARLEIEVTGTPEPTVTWYKDGEQIKTSNLYRIITQGNSHLLLIDNATDEHSGRYMAKATNAGGMAQTMADLVVCESAAPMEVYNVRSNYPEIVSTTTQQKSSVEKSDEIRVDKTVEESVQKSKDIVPGDKIVSVTETVKTEKKVSLKVERAASPNLSITEKEPEEPSTEEIDRTSIPKQSALDFFKTKMKESEEESKKVAEVPKPKPAPHPVPTEEAEAPPMPEVFSKQSAIVSQLKTVQSQEEGPVEEVKKSAITLARESYSLVKEEKSFSSFVQDKPAEPVMQSEFNLTPEPPPEIGFIPKTEKVKTREDISEKVKKLEEFHKVSSPIDAPSGGVRLFPIIPPKQEAKPVVEEVKPAEPVRKIETLPALSWLSEQTIQKEEKKEVQEVIEKKMFSPPRDWEQKILEPRPFSPRPSAEGLAMEKLWASKKTTEETVDSSKLTGFYRPGTGIEPMRATSPRPSAEGVAMEKLWIPQKPRPASALGISGRCMSPKPSQEGIAMDKIWAHKHKESNLKVSWPPPQPKEEKPIIPWSSSQDESRVWPPEQKEVQEPEIVREVKTLKQTTTPIQHYIAESRLIRQTRSMDRQDFITTESSTITKSSFMENYSQKKVWQKESSLQAPSLVKQVIGQKEPGLEPCPPPEIGFAAPPERRTSYVETVEQDLQKDLQRQPKKQLPGAVRIIPPPMKKEIPKKEVKRSNSLESRPFERFPELEPFPFKPDPPKPKPAKCPPPPTPTKFVKGNFMESDYESDYDSRISVKWRPYESDSEDLRYRRVRPPVTTPQPKRPQSTEPEPLPPSKFETPAESTGATRPVLQTGKILYQTRKEVIQPFAESYKKTETKKKVIKTVKAASPPKLKAGSPPEYLHAAGKPKSESPKAKQTKVMRPPESGYMADTDEPLIFQKQKTMSTTVKHSTAFKEIEMSKKETFPELEPFPFKPEPVRPQPRKVGPPPPSPSKFIKGEFRGSDYESDYDAKIQPVWNSEGQSYKPVRPVLTPSGRHTFPTTGRTPTPPTEFDVPPRMEGPSRPKFEPIAPAPTSSRVVKLDEIIHSRDNSQFLIKPKPMKQQPEVNLRPGSPPQMGYAPAYPKAVETSNVMSFREDTETSRRVVNMQQTTRMISFSDKQKKGFIKPVDSDYDSEMENIRPFKKVGTTKTSFQHSDAKSKFISTQQNVREPDIILQPGEPPEFRYAQVPVETATSYANKHMKDMTQAFKSKAQQFMSDVISDSKKPEKPILKSTKQNGSEDPHTYREENRLSEFGTKHIDPDTGLIYFKYDFGYEFGVLLPGEGGGKKAVSGGTKKPLVRRESIDFPIIHEKTDKSEGKTKKMVHHKSVKWDAMSESELSEVEDRVSRKRHSLPSTAKAPQVYIPGNRWESSPSPMSLSPSIPSLSPMCQRSTPLGDSTASPTWMRGGTPTSTTPGLNQKSVTNPSNEPVKAPNFITPLRDIAVVSGQPARFECIVQAEPTPNILWSKDGRIIERSLLHEIQYKNGVCRLSIAQAFPGDAGTYTCTATNMAGTSATTATLQVPGERRGVRNH